MKKERIYFLDAVRAFAILMMLQGHFIDSLMLPHYKSESYILFNIWSYFRGITAPVFFTITGLIFCYLLTNASNKKNTRKRIKKGLKRALILILIGYTLRTQLLNWLKGEFYDSFLVVDVLQCIGTSLILFILTFIITRHNKILLTIVLLLSSTVIFCSEPLYRNLKLENTPVFLGNYFSKANGSVFTLLPWLGYVFYGATIGLWLDRLRNKWFSLVCLISGLLLIFTSSYVLKFTGNLTQLNVLVQASTYNYLYTRLGNVLIIFAFFNTIEHKLKNSFFSEIGTKTLSIYVLHFIILYGSITGLGLNRYLNKSLSPTWAITGALIFLIVITLISFYFIKTNKHIYKKIKNLFNKKKAKKERKILHK